MLFLLFLLFLLRLASSFSPSSYCYFSPPFSPRTFALLSLGKSDDTSYVVSSVDNGIVYNVSDGASLTNAVLRISFDGSRFHGSSANGRRSSQGQSQLGNIMSWAEPRSRRRRRGRRHKDQIHRRTSAGTGIVRTVEGVIRDNLSKLYGNVDPRRIVVESCSRTDKGVHATCMIAHIYCLRDEIDLKTKWWNDKESPISGKRNPHPKSPFDDSYFVPLPMQGNLRRIAFSMNRMRPSDVQITGISPTPTLRSSTGYSNISKPSWVFQASLSCISKTYHYRISKGDVDDPTMQRVVWHIGPKHLDLEKMEQAALLLEGTHDFVAFRGAPRGDTDKKRFATQDTTCNLLSFRIVTEMNSLAVEYFGDNNPPLQQYYTFEVTGDRFLYRMVRFLVGAVIAVGLNKLDLNDISRAMETGSWVDSPINCHRKQFTCAPAHGLVLKDVHYGDDVQFDWQPLR